MMEGDKIIGFQIIARDITERKQAEEALRSSEETARALLNATTDSVFLINRSGTVLALNEMAGKRLNRRVDEMVGACLYDFLPPDLAIKRKARFDEVFRTGKPAYFEDERQGIHFDNCVYPISDGSGKVTKIAIYGRDITEQKRAQEALRKSEEKYRTILENIEEGYYEVDLTGRFTFLNQSMCRIFGYPEDGLMGMNNRQYTDQENARRVFQTFNQVYRTSQPHTLCDYEIIRKDGNKRYVETSASLLKDSSGKPIGFRGILRDITERKEAEKALRESEERYRILVETSPDAISLFDLNLNIQMVNEPTLKLFGYGKYPEVIGKSVLDFLMPEQLTRAREDVGKVLETGSTAPVEYTLIKKDRTLFPAELKASLILDKQKKPSAILCVIRDITERKAAEEALKRSEERYRILVESSTDAILMLDLERNITAFNQAFLDMFGYEKSEIEGRTIRMIHTSDESFRSFGNVAYSLIEELGFFRGEWDLKHKDGTIVPVETVTSAIKTPDGLISGYIAIIRDVTERKRAEGALRKSEEKFRKQFEEALDAIFIADAETGILVDCNRAACELVGMEKSELIGTHQRVLHPPRETEEELSRTFRQHLQEKEGKVLETQVFTKKGEIKEVAIKANIIELGGKKLLQGIFRDITEPKRAEERLKQSEENARQLAQGNAVMAEIGKIISSTLNIGDVYELFAEEVRELISFDRIMINITDPDRKTVSFAYISGIDTPGRQIGDVVPLAGTATEEVLRTRSSLLVQTENIEEAARRFPGLIPSFQAGLRSMIFVPLIFKNQVIGILSIRSTRPNAYTDQQLKLSENIATQIAGAIANARLFAEHIRSEEEKTALQEQLRQSQKMEAIGQLAGGVAHDFNNLLTVIRGYSQLALDEIKKDDPLRANIEEIRIATDRAADLTRQLLAFSRRQVMEMRVLDLNEVLANLDKMLHRVIGEDIDLVTMPEKNLGRVKIDPGQMEQVIMNLAVNARDAMPDGGKLTIETGNVELDQAYARAHVAVTPGRYVMVSVSDTGVGMAPEIRDRVFEPFFTTKSKGKGTGLGLSTVYGIVKQSGGNIWVYSEPGKGTTFKIYLPCVADPSPGMKDRLATKELSQGSETILIVEDEEVVLKLAERILRKQGYEVWGASSAEEALKMCKEQRKPFHLLLTDVVMPQMGGRQLADRLQETCQDFKVLYMSGYTDNAITHHGVLDKGVNYLQKPFTVESLARKVREVLDR